MHSYPHHHHSLWHQSHRCTCSWFSVILPAAISVADHRLIPMMLIVWAHTFWCCSDGIREWCSSGIIYSFWHHDQQHDRFLFFVARTHPRTRSLSQESAMVHIFSSTIFFAARAGTYLSWRNQVLLSLEGWTYLSVRCWSMVLASSICATIQCTDIWLSSIHGFIQRLFLAIGAMTLNTVSSLPRVVSPCSVVARTFRCHNAFFFMRCSTSRWIDTLRYLARFVCGDGLNTQAMKYSLGLLLVLHSMSIPSIPFQFLIPSIILQVHPFHPFQILLVHCSSIHIHPFLLKHKTISINLP